MEAFKRKLQWIFALGLLKRNNNLIISPRAWGGSTEAECTPLYCHWMCPACQHWDFLQWAAQQWHKMQRKQFTARGRLGLSSFKRTHCGLPLMKVRHLLIDIDVFWLIVETKPFFPEFFSDGLLFTQLSSPTGFVVLSWPTLKNPTSPCVSPVSSTVLQQEWTLSWGAESPGVGRCFIGFPTLRNCRAWLYLPAPPRVLLAVRTLPRLIHCLCDMITPTAFCGFGTIPVKAACIKCHWCYLAFLASPLQFSPPSILQPEHLLNSTVLFLAYLCRM